jgi:hypothetical protein
MLLLLPGEGLEESPHWRTMAEPIRQQLVDPPRPGFQVETAPEELRNPNCRRPRCTALRQERKEGLEPAGNQRPEEERPSEAMNGHERVSDDVTCSNHAEHLGSPVR